jgi:hypothetical protein
MLHNSPLRYESIHEEARPDEPEGRKEMREMKRPWSKAKSYQEAVALGWDNATGECSRCGEPDSILREDGLAVGMYCGKCSGELLAESIRANEAATQEMVDGGRAR